MFRSFCNQAFRALMPLIAKCRPLYFMIALTFGFTMGMGAMFKMIRAAGIANVFKWKTRKLPEFVNDADLGVHSSFKTSEGISLHMVSKGDSKKPVMLFLHGFPDCWFTWRAQMKAFSDQYRCVALSLRGYADSDKPKTVDSYKMRLLLNDVKETIEFLGEKNVILVAHDWGGVIAWRFAAHFPEMVSRMIIINAPHFTIYRKLIQGDLGQFLKSWYIFFFQLPWLPEMMVKLADYRMIDVMFGGLLKQKKITSEELELYKYYMSQNGSLSCMINYYRSSVASNPSEDHVPKITVPTQVLWGAADMALDLRNLEGLDQHVETLEVVTLPGVTHWAQQDAPDEVNKQIKEFLARTNA